MHQSRITLQIVAKINMVVDDGLQIIDRGIIITTAKIESGNFIIEDECAVMIYIAGILTQFFSNLRNQRQALLKGAGHQVPVNFRQINIDPGMYPEIIVVLTLRG